MNRRRAGLMALVVLLLVVVALAQPRRSEGRPLDPRSTEPLGARGLVLLLQELGADVAIGSAVPRMTDADTVLLLLADDLGDERREEVWSYVERGGVLVVADPFSVFAPAIERSPAPVEPREARGDSTCGLAATRGVEHLDVAGSPGFRARDDQLGCFPIGDGFFLVARAEGAGSVVALAGGGPLVNVALDEGDHAVLAANLLAPRPDMNVIVLEPAPGEGRVGLFGLVGPGIKNGLLQLAIAFVVVALWRGRRIAPPVTEPDPVEIPAAELVAAMGDLLQVARRRNEAATMLRLQLRRTISARLGLPPDAPAEQLAEAASARTGIDSATLLSALAPYHVSDDASLEALAGSLERLRRELLHA